MGLILFILAIAAIIGGIVMLVRGAVVAGVVLIVIGAILFMLPAGIDHEDNDGAQRADLNWHY